ncbi:MAG: GGDEF domain-containing protein [Sulfuricurvum sp.]|nr:GGDEF domain-containing protein [Sulfuricurvum sp.]
MLLIDVDHFKTINDTYGHSDGDKVLRKIADLIQTHTRDTDVCVRWGGRRVYGYRHEHRSGKWC